MRPLARIWCSILCSRRRTGPANTPMQLSTGDKLHVDINVNRNEGTPPDPASSDSTGPSFFVARKYEFEAHVNPFCALLHPHSVSCNEALSRALRMAGKSPQGRCHIHTSDITTRRCFRCCDCNLEYRPNGCFIPYLQKLAPKTSSRTSIRAADIVKPQGRYQLAPTRRISNLSVSTPPRIDQKI
jgi:hypothetical protein